MSFEEYRRTKIGDALVSALDDMIGEGRLHPQQALVILGEFDKVLPCLR